MSKLLQASRCSQKFAELCRSKSKNANCRTVHRYYIQTHNFVQGTIPVCFTQSVLFSFVYQTQFPSLTASMLVVNPFYIAFTQPSPSKTVVKSGLLSVLITDSRDRARLQENVRYFSFKNVVVLLCYLRVFQNVY